MLIKKFQQRIFKVVFGNSQQEKEEVISSNYNWNHLKNIHTKYNADYFASLLESIGYKIIKIEKSQTKFFLKADKCSNS